MSHLAAAMNRGIPVLLVSLALGCGPGAASGPGASGRDGGAEAASVTDAGTPGDAATGADGGTDSATAEAATLDTGAGGSPDAIAPGTDAETDAGTDASDDAPSALAADTPVVPCSDAVSDVYVTPPGLPPMDMASRGAIVRCAHEGILALSDIASAFSSKGVTGVTASSEVDVYRIEYRTYREDGVPGASSARVYLPRTPRSMPLPVVAVAHPTEGLAASCTPSQSPTSLEDEALPWAASGFAVVATDYAGLGTPGVQGYLANHDQAHSVLDSARALRTMLAPGVFDDRVMLVGYSQGGGAVLASQGLARSYGSGGQVVGVVVFAAEYFMRMNSQQFVTTLDSPTALTIASGVTIPVVAATRDYAYAYNVLGADAGAVPFPSGSGIPGALTSLCEVPFGGYVQGVAPHLGDLFDDGFRTSLLACIEGDAGCSGPGQAFYQWLQGDLVAPDPAGAPVLYVAGLSDTIMPPAQEAACNIGQLQQAGVSVQVCTDQAAQHTDVVARNVPFALTWSERVLYGGAMPSCSSAGMPACTP